MQPFDGGAFDQRYREVYAPAIKAANLDPYRADQDASVSIPIQEIESGIRQAQICLAEITLDNPNVWFELGYAIACKKEVVLICSDARTTRFPFDVQHRTIIKYSTRSPSDFDKLRENISSKIKAYLEKAEAIGNIPEVSQLAAPSEGFSDIEIVALAAVTQNLNHDEDHAAVSQVHRDMEASGYTKIAANFAIKVLIQKGFIVSDSYEDEGSYYYFGCKITERGWAWMLANQNRFVLRVTPVEKKGPFDVMSDEIPF